ATASASKGDFVRGLGADEVIDYHAVDFAEVVRDIDVVLETVGGDYGERSLRTLRPGGLLITIVQRTDAALARKTEAAGKRFAGVTVEPDHAGLEALAEWVDGGRLKVHVEGTHPLAAAARAHERLGQSVTGKLVLTMDAAHRA